MRFISTVAVFVLVAFADAGAQQVADSSFHPSVSEPTYPEATGPTVLIDEAHFNFHTASGRHLPFARLLRRDGYVVTASAVRFSRESLIDADILVISNAIAEQDQDDWSLPMAPPAELPSVDPTAHSPIIRSREAANRLNVSIRSQPLPARLFERRRQSSP